MKRKFIGLFAVLLMAFNFVGVVSVQAAGDFKGELCGGADLTLKQGDCGGGNQKTLDGVVGAIVNILSVIVGIAAVIMIIIGGFRFITSGGDSGRITSARQTIVYALIGLVIAISAETIVLTLLDRI